MVSLPKVKKSPKRTLSRLEKAQSVVGGVALALGITLIGFPANEANAALAPTAAAQSQPANSSMLLAAAHSPNTIVADHYSHESHYSHQSHHSHYSSRY